MSCLGVTLLHAPGPSGRDSLLSNDKRRRRACVNTAAPQSLSSEPAHCHSGSLVEVSSETKPKVKGGPRSLCGRVYELEGQERGHRAAGGGAGGEILYSARVQTACHMDRRDSVGSAGTERWGSSSNGPVCCSLRFKLHCGPLGTASPGQAAFPPVPRATWSAMPRPLPRLVPWNSLVRLLWETVHFTSADRICCLSKIKKKEKKETERDSSSDGCKG